MAPSAAPARAPLAAALAALAIAVAVAGAPAAAANQRQESVFMDDNLLLYRGARTSDRTLDELKAMGVDRVRVSLHWRAIAPRHRATRRPSPLRYGEGTFAPWDHLLRAARARGMGVVVNVTGGAPLWATGRRDGRHVNLQWKPDAREFERFVAMLGRRYDGAHGPPRITAWSIWNEPNFPAQLLPQWEGGRPASPRIYRSLVRAALRGLKATGHGDDIVLLGETSPVGVDDRTASRPMRPALFLRELLCLDEDLLPVHRPGCDFDARGRFEVTGYAHHPYPITSPPDEPSAHPDDIRLADGARLVRILDAAAGRARIPPDLPLWYTELGWQTAPDPVRGVPLADQAAWIARAERMTWADDRVAANTQFLMLDDVPRRHLPRRHPSYWGTYQSGLRFADGRRKPAYDAYRLALDAPRSAAPGGLVLWGFVRAAPNGEPTRVALEHKPPGADRFVRVPGAAGTVEVTDPRGYFQLTPPQLSGTWRYVWRGMASNPVEVRVG